MAREKYDWDKLKAKYLSGSHKNLRDFAEKEGINYDVLRRKASKWQSEKSQASHAKVTKIVTKTIEKIAEKESDRNARILSISDLAADAIEEYLKEKHYKKHVIKYKYYDCEGKPDKEELKAVILPVADTKALANMISSLDKIQKGQRLAEGLMSEYERQRLELEKTKINPPEETDLPDDGFMDAMKADAKTIWADEGEPDD